MSGQLGDGPVSLESAQQVKGTHVTIIRNLGGKSERVVPAIPVVLHELRQEEP